MSAEENQMRQSTPLRSNDFDASSSGYIDDYSQLRLSYYQHRGTISDITDISGDTSTEEQTFDTVETSLNETSVTVDEKEASRQKLRDYYISQIPDLPHPSYVVASIISSASRKMGSIHLRYNDRIEQGKAPDSRNDSKFDPERRSTLKPNQFPNN
ncbi:hypothetical protein SFRURICE_013386 [Spodoptera frugiperda]|uniref:SFRICE_021375 n=1 Tax=Spodoptera frugiperda TaxID=7108 RepID=A0A2H1W4E9_SPOFR|nr:uncharacterized protein LOC126910931 [Spodoptera frugiperda]KAF9823849.1 hypothetical protein SFRURICE_013386 [Spodoptera frugiperda]